MKLHHTIPLLALLVSSAVHAQRDVVIDVAPPKMEESYDSNEPFTVVEEMPEFHGGQEALFAYIGSELKYPEVAVENGAQGVVFVTFVVEADGSISNPKVMRGIGYGCDEEAWRVVKGMPNWKPGKQRGETVRVQYNLPIRFKL